VIFIGVAMEGLADTIDALSCGEDERAEEALTHLAVWGAEAVEPLKERFASPDADVRWWAVRGLAEVADPRVPELLVKALADPDKAVRWCAGAALRAHPSPQAIPALVVMLADPEALTRRLAGDALVAVGSPAVAQLLEVMKGGEGFTRLEAVRALAKIGDPQTIPALFEALDDGSALIEHWASEGLEKMGVGMMFFKPD
jgi:HEAT repeat protein